MNRLKESRRSWLLLPIVLLHMALAACATTPATVDYNPPPPAVLAEAWAAPYQEYETTEQRIFYRAFGGGSSRLGAWMSPIRPISTTAVRAAMALPPENAADQLTVVTVPAGTLIRIGRAAPAFGQPGGGEQVQLMELISPVSFSEPIPLPPQ